MQIDAYVKRVNSVVDQHRGGNVEQFRVYIDLVDERYIKVQQVDGLILLRKGDFRNLSCSCHAIISMMRIWN